MQRHIASQQRHDTAVALVDKLGALFAECDDNGDGVLDAQELAKILRRFYRESEKVARPLRQIEREVRSVLSEYAAKESGSLDFWEFVTMVADRPETFKL